MSRLPSVTSPIPHDLRRFIDRVREASDSGASTAQLSAAQLDAVASAAASQLADSGVLGSGGGYDPGPYVYPPAPTGLTTTGSLGAIMLQWDAPAYTGHSYTEIWVSPTDVVGDAELLDNVPGYLYTHTLGDSTSRYYWVRFVNIAGEIGPYNAVAGTLGTTGTDPAYALEVLTGQITEAQLYKSLSSWDAVSSKADSAALDSVYEVKVDANGRVAGFGMVSDAAATDFGILADRFWVADPSAAPFDSAATYAVGDRFTYSDVTYKVLLPQTPPNVTPPNVTYYEEVAPVVPFVVVGGKVYLDAALIRDATITSAKIGQLAVTEAHIGAEAVTESKIGQLAVTEAHIGAEAVTESKIGQLAVTEAHIQDGAVTNLKIGNVIESTDGVTWSIDKNGSIDCRDLIIRNADGTILLQSNGTLDFDNVSGANKPADGADSTAAALSATTEISTGGLKMTDSATGDFTLMSPASHVYSHGSVNMFEYANGVVTIRKADGTTIFSSGTGVDLANVTGAGAFAGLDKITSANQSTYIQSLLVPDAWIGNATISGAKIKNAGIDTLQLAGECLFVPRGVTPTGNTTGTTTEKTITDTGYFTIDSAGQTILVTLDVYLYVYAGSRDTARGEIKIYGGKGTTLLRTITNGPYTDGSGGTIRETILVKTTSIAGANKFRATLKSYYTQGDVQGRVGMLVQAVQK